MKLGKKDCYLIFSIAVVIIYTIIEQILSVRTGFERSALTTGVYAFFGTEIGSCCLIRILGNRSEGGEG